MTKFDNLKFQVEEGVVRLTINRPKKLNAINQDTINELREAMQEIYDNKEIKGVIISGEGEKAFISGADIKEISKLNEVYGRKFSENGQEVFALIEDCPKPIIAAINGFALGGGCELAMACHIRVAVEEAKLGQPEVKLGIIPGYGGTQRLPKLIGKGRALELMMTGDQITAEEAFEMGLVNHVVYDHSELIPKAEEILKKILNNAPLAIGMVIGSVNAAETDAGGGYQTEANSFANCCKTEDFKEGISAFIDKRKAEFKGE